MEEKKFESVKYDYYTNTSSYIKMILEELPESSFSYEKKQIVKDIFNHFMNEYNKTLAPEMNSVTGLYREVVDNNSKEVVANNVEFFRLRFLEPLIFAPIFNRLRIFIAMHEFIKVSVGYYTDYQLRGRNGLSEKEKENSLTI